MKILDIAIKNKTNINKFLKWAFILFALTPIYYIFITRFTDDRLIHILILSISLIGKIMTLISIWGLVILSLLWIVSRNKELNNYPFILLLILGIQMAYGRLVTNNLKDFIHISTMFFGKYQLGTILQTLTWIIRLITDSSFHLPFV